MASQSEAQKFYNKQIGFAFVLFITVIVSFLFWFIRGQIKNEPFFEKRAKPSDTTSKDKFVVTVCVVLYLLYPTLCQSAFKIFKCEPIGMNSFLGADYEEQCFVKSILFTLWLLVSVKLLFLSWECH